MVLENDTIILFWRRNKDMGGASSKEKRQHGSVRIPYGYYESRIPEFFPMVPLHWHNEFEINYVISGKSEFVYGNERFVTDTGDIVILPPNMLHAVYPHGDAGQIYDTLVFRGEMFGVNKEERGWVSHIEPIINGNRGITAPITAKHRFYGEIRKSVEHIFRCSKKNESIADLYLKSELLHLICLLEEGDCIKTVKNREDKSMESIRSVLVYINRNYRENISVEQLADMVHLSKSYFMYLFKQVSGVSAIGYIIQLRIREACELLRNSDDTSAEIAFACGFQNLSNFNRQFKSCVGYTPGQYRRLQKGLAEELRESRR